MMDSTKYRVGYFPVEKKYNKWVEKDHVEKAPIWCSVDMRDGNQSLVIPMSLEEKLEYFKMLLDVGFKEIEVGFPAASETEYEFLRTLIDNNMIPEDVTVQVLTQCREHIIRKTFDACKGAPSAIIHFYNSVSVAQREQVFKKSKEEIKQIAVEGAKLVKELSNEYEGNFRDEDLRADRQPEFTQVDMELSFVDVEDVISVNERLIQYVCKEAIGLEVPLPIPRMTWKDAMNRFGSDKPDTRFGMELQDVSKVVADCGFGVFTSALANGGSVRGINAKGQAEMPRKKIDALVEFAKGYGAKGLAYLCVMPDGSYKSSFAKFMTEAELENLVAAMQGEPGDLLLFAADKNTIVWNVLGGLRLELGRQMGLIDDNKFNFLWVTEFPLLEWSEEDERYVAMHHPFTMPMDEDLALLDTDPGKVRAKAYDIVLNGTELGGGSVRIFQTDVQEKMFEVLGFTKEAAYDRFGFLLNAFKYGVPPHAGLAYGLDRLVMLLVKAESIREVIAFPKVKDASCLMTNAPDVVDEKQLEELQIALALQEKAEE